MGRTLFQMLKNRASGPAEFKVYNPLNLKVGANIRIDAIDMRDLSFVITGLRENNRRIDGEDNKMVDYCLAGLPLSSNTLPVLQKVRLRLLPLDNPDPVSGLTHNVMVLSLYYECWYQEAQDGGLIDALNAGTGEFEIDWNDTQRKYYRINDVKAPYLSNVKVLEDLDGNGQVEEDEIREQVVEYWDFHTELLNEASLSYIEYLYVEKNKDDGKFQIWRGSEVSPEKVVTL